MKDILVIRHKEQLGPPFSTSQLAIQASQRDRDCHREPPGGPVWEATGADHQPRREKDTQRQLVGIFLEKYKTNGQTRNLKKKSKEKNQA